MMYNKIHNLACAELSILIYSFSFLSVNAIEASSCFTYNFIFSSITTYQTYVLHSVCVTSWMTVIVPEGHTGVVLKGWGRNWIQLLWKWNKKKLDFI